jgi:hypothetical protein
LQKSADCTEENGTESNNSCLDYHRSPNGQK